MKRRFALTCFVFVGLSVAAAMATARAAEEVTVEALATYQSYGRIFLVAENEALFVGGFEGIMFAENGSGALNTAKIICPGMMALNFDDGRSVGEGRCIITVLQGDRVFAKWQCAGLALIGCKGTFDLTAGTGRFQGITGGGDFMLRTAISKFSRDMSEDNVEGIGLGLAMWPNLKYRLP